MNQKLLIVLSALSLSLVVGCTETHNYYTNDEKTATPDDGKDATPDDEKPVIDNTENTQARCSDGIDNDGNGSSDCGDPNCAAFSFCQKTEDGKENTLAACIDNIDNDGDGDVDCDDAECKQFTICQEKVAENTEPLCKDGLDNDGDGNIDCNDAECKSFYFCIEEVDETIHENTLAQCTDGIDNDEDGDLDCLDTECQVFAICQELIGIAENTRELCSDGIDNDFSGKKDCEEESCALFCNHGGASGENTYALCGDGVDNDGDGKKDCDDPECSGYDICNGLTSDDEDACPDDPYKYKADDCGCGKSQIEGVCYTNITSWEEFKAIEKEGNYILKAPIDVSELTEPIAFDGKFDGGNQRITGVVNQSGPKCGLFTSLNEDSALTNVDLAITLNCSVVVDQFIYVGGLAAQWAGTATHIQGSSKVYVYEDGTNQSPRTLQYIGSIFGMMRGIMSDIHVSGNLSVEELSSAPISLNKTDEAKYYYVSTYIGGVTGAVLKDFQNVSANSNITTKFIKKKTKACNDSAINYYIGGITGASRDVSIQDSHYQGYIKVIHDDSYSTDHYEGYEYIGGISGIGSSVQRSSVAGTLDVSTHTLYNKDSKYPSQIGGILGLLTSNKEKVQVPLIDRCQSDVDIRVGMVGTAIGGIVGNVTQTQSRIFNNRSRVDLTLLDGTMPDKNLSYANFYGGIVGTMDLENNAWRAGFIINNSARTNYVQEAEHRTSGYNDYSVSRGGIVGPGYYGVIANNFVSDQLLKCPEGKGCQSISATNGDYVYETYWNQDVFGNETGAKYTDASAQGYTYNLEGIPVTRNNESILGLLRYNVGYDGGVLSANIPSDADYSNWTTMIDEEGHVIPVPEP